MFSYHDSQSQSLRDFSFDKGCHAGGRAPGLGPAWQCCLGGRAKGNAARRLGEDGLSSCDEYAGLKGPNRLVHQTDSEGTHQKGRVRERQYGISQAFRDQG